jgi:NADP-dependent 3-hydroxy acid dehydrogenase YdfG
MYCFLPKFTPFIIGGTMYFTQPENKSLFRLPENISNRMVSQGESTTSTTSALGVPGFALVTGAASGIGRAIVHLLAREGCAGIALADINLASAQAVQAELKSLSPNPKFKCVAIRVDVQDEESIVAMVKDTVAAFSRIDYAVNCAGIGMKKPLAETELQDWNRMIGINMTGVFLCLKAEVKQMMSQQSLTTDR